MKSNYRKLGDYIRQVDVRNTEGKEDHLLGVSVQKMFMPSIANTIGTDFSKYKVVKRGQFTYIPDTSRRGDKIAIALLKDYDEGLVSNIYTVFEISDSQKLLPEYLMLWFSRPEFDRYARFKSHGSVREIMDWDELCKVELPIPSYEAQAEIVREYQTIADRIAIKQKINDNLEELITSVFDWLFVKNNIPFTSDKLGNITGTIDNRGRTPPNIGDETPYPLIEIASLRTKGRITTYRNCSKYVSKEIYDNWFRSGHPKQKDILMSTVGSLAELKLFWGTKGSIAQNIVAFRCKNPYMPMYLYQYMTRKQRELSAYEIGSVQASIKVSQVIDYDIDIPPDELLMKFDRFATNVTKQIYTNEIEMDLCYKIQNLILQKLSVIE